MALRVGIVGSGFGGTAHAPAYRLHPLYEVVALASPRNAARVAGELGIPHHFSDVDAMLAAVGESLDIVSVATPPSGHYHAVMAAIAAGKHVLCEKPFALTLEQATEMTAAAAAAGVAGALAFEFRFAPAVQTMRRYVLEGQLPRLREVEIVRWGSELVATSKRPPSSWWYDGAQGGGIANAFMPHLVDLACFLAGRAPHAASGLIRTANGQRIAPDGTGYVNTASDGAFALLDLGDGLVGKVTADGTRARNRCVYALGGETQRLVAAGPDMLDMQLVLSDAEQARALAADPARHPEAAGERPNVRLFLSLLDEFARAIGGHDHHCPTFADGLTVQRVLDAIGYGRTAPAFGSFDHLDVRIPSLPAVESFYDALMPALGLARKRRMHVDANGEWHDSDGAHPYNTVEYYEPAGTRPAPHFIGFIEDRTLRPSATRIAFRIAPPDLDRLRTLLGTLGAREVFDETATDYPALFFEDPAGTRLELIVRSDSA